MIRNFEKYFLDVITHKQKGFVSSCLRFFLLILSWPYRLLIACRNWTYDHGWVRRYSPPVPVVMSIGNIVVGGTGKTPVTLLIAQEFYQHFSLAILSRGYRAPAEKLSIPIILSNGNGPIQSASFCGDEPYLLAQNLPKATVIVGRDRHKAADIAAREGVKLLLLDDGMQHRRLARDFEVVVVDASDPFGQGHFLPRGLLRESLDSLKRADLIVLNHTDGPDGFLSIKKKLERYHGAVVVGTRMEVVGVKLFGGETIPSLEGKKVGIFCGIAHPEYFCQTVKKLGAEIVDMTFAGDHRGFDSASLAAFATSCKELGAEYLVCTEKDKVKIPEVQQYVLPLVWVQMRLEVVQGAAEWHAFMDKVRGELRKSSE